MSTATQTARTKLAPLPPRTPLQGKQKLIAALATRFGRVYLDSERLFRIWSNAPTRDNLKRYTKSLRRLATLQEAERALAA